MKSQRRIVVESSSDEEQTEKIVDQGQEQVMFDYESDQSETLPIVIRKPTKDDRLQVHLAGQRALRELQFELPVRKSKIHVNSFLAARGIKREDALEDYHKSLRPKKDTDQNEYENGQEEDQDQSQDDVSEPKEAPEPTDIIKRTHLVPTKSKSDSESDVELEIIEVKAKPSGFLQNQITTNILKRKEDTLRLAQQQIQDRSLAEIEAKKKYIEEMKRKRIERRENRLLEEAAALALKEENKAREAEQLGINVEDKNDDATVDEPKVDKDVDVELPDQSPMQSDDDVEAEAEDTQDIQETSVHLEYKTDSEGYCELTRSMDGLDSGSDLDDNDIVQSAVSVPDFPVQDLEPLVLDDHDEHAQSDCHDEIMDTINQKTDHQALKSIADEPEDHMLDLLSGNFTSQAQDEDHQAPAENDTVLDFLSGGFPETQDLVKGANEGVGAGADNVLDLLSGAFPETQVLWPQLKSVDDEKAATRPLVNESVTFKDSQDFEPSSNAAENTIPAASLTTAPESLKSVDGPDDEAEKSMGAEIQENQDDSSECSQSSMKVVGQTKTLSLQEIIFMDNDTSEEEEEQVVEFKQPVFKPWVAPKPGPEKRFVETEADVEEDEFMNYGGIDGEDLNGPDEYDKSLVNDMDSTPVNAEAIMELHQ